MIRFVSILPVLLATNLACSEHDSKIGAKAIAPQAAMAGARPEKSGADLYKNCVACHQADGKGMAGLAPTLVGSEWVNGDPAYVVAILQSGLEGPIQVAGEIVNIPGMASWSKPWSDQELANLLNHIRSEAFGNDGGELVTAEQVGTIREPIKDRAPKWTADELIALYGSPFEEATDAGGSVPDDASGSDQDGGTAMDPNGSDQAEAPGSQDDTEASTPVDGGAGQVETVADPDDAPNGSDAPSGEVTPATDGAASPGQTPDVPVPTPESTTPGAPTPTSAPAGDEGGAASGSP